MSSTQAPRHFWRWVLLVAGVALLTVLIYGVGPALVWQTISAAGPFLIPVVLFDAGWFAAELASHRVLLQETARNIPMVTFVRTSLSSYALLILVPLGRAAAEVARAASFSKYVTGPTAASAATNVQAASLIANCLASIPCALAVALTAGVTHLLFVFTLVNCLLTGLGGLALLLVLRHSRVGARLARAFPRMVPAGATLDDAFRLHPGALGKAVFFAFLGRLSQTGQYGVMLAAVGGGWSLPGALISQGIHLVGALVGDLVPNQLGVQEGAFRLFAETIGFAQEPARAISIALVARVSMVILASATLIGLTLLRPTANDK